MIQTRTYTHEDHICRALGCYRQDWPNSAFCEIHQPEYGMAYFMKIPTGVWSTVTWEVV